ncbi:hypothetical protein HPB48_001084 [Haemaphysalis longicornis]|uniref:Uncharacterized protein n=1 Tax=Haemaphysalis longicornis TaxID=44386 RepID=A0A9J6GCJ8_HAELO|nr:hypothetical protein HPB48_001084 [Haemaphysalis longicornis]
MPRRPPLYLRLNRVGHIRRQCRMPRCEDCHQFLHSADQCVVTYADKLWQAERPPDEVLKEHLLDATQVLDATCELPTDSVVRAGGSLSTSSVNGDSINAAPDVTAASVGPEVTCEASISSLEPVPGKHIV